MKKITKILIATGIAGIIGKVIHDKYDITFNFEMQKKNKASCNINQKCENDACNEPDLKIKLCELIEPISEDHVYYDNPYNVKIIYKYKGCPFAFEFENTDDRESASKLFYLYFLNKNNKVTVSEIFILLGLIIDDYSDFQNYFTCWDPNDFYKENTKYNATCYLSFGTMEAPKEEMK